MERRTLEEDMYNSLQGFDYIEEDKLPENLRSYIVSYKYFSTGSRTLSEVVILRKKGMGVKRLRVPNGQGVKKCFRDIKKCDSDTFLKLYIPDEDIALYYDKTTGILLGDYREIRGLSHKFSNLIN